MAARRHGAEAPQQLALPRHQGKENKVQTPYPKSLEAMSSSEEVDLHL